MVVSQWTSFLQVIGNNLAKMPDANFAVFSGNTKLADRQVYTDLRHLVIGFKYDLDLIFV